MAHAGRPASRHGTHEAFRKEYASENAADELPSQSVFNYEGTEDVREVRENPIVHRQMSTTNRTMSHGVIPSGPVVAVHMFDVPSDKSDSGDNTSPTPSQGLRRWSREALDGTNNGFPPASPQPPSTPRSSQPGSMRRRSLSAQRPPSSQSQRPSSKKSARDYSLDQEDALPPMTTLRPQSSLGKYLVLPSISPTQDRDRLLTVDIMGTSRSDGSEDQRGAEDMEYLTSRMAHQALVEASRKSSRDSLPDRPGSRDSATSDSRHPSGRSRSIPDSEPVAVIPTDRHGLQQHCDSSASSTSSDLANDRSPTSLSQYKMDEAPKPSVEGQILLGVKIPTDGTRHKHYFNPRDQLRCIVLFAEEVSGEDFSNHALVQASPRQCFSNLSQTIEAAGLESKSVLHLEELD